MIKYDSSKYQIEKLVDRYGLPGGQIDFGEQLDDSIIREVQEETGATIIPGEPIYTWTWIYQKEDTQKQIIAVARLAQYKIGELIKSNSETEVSLAKALWINIEDITEDNIVHDEWPAIEILKQKYL